MILIRNRSMQIPREEQTIGVVGDGMTASRVFRIARREANENDLSSLSFRLDIEYQDGTKNVAMLQKSLGDGFFDLLWTVTANDLKSEKTLFVQIRGTDVQGTVRWHSLKAPFYVGGADRGLHGLRRHPFGAALPGGQGGRHGGGPVKGGEVRGCEGDTGKR